MTKQQLLDRLSEKFYKLPKSWNTHTELGITTYEGYPYIKSGDIIYRQYVSFYVENEGLPEETAYWGGGEPRPTPTQPFTSKVQDFINTKISAGTQIKFAWIVASNETQKKAYVSGFNTTNVSKNGIVSDDGSGNLTIELF